MRNALALILTSLLVAAVTAQQPKPAVPDPYGVEPIIRANAEVNILVGLSPLKLSKDDAKKVHDVLVANRGKLLKSQTAIQKKEADALKKLEKDVYAARDKAMKGEKPSDSYYDAWDKVMKTSMTDRALLRVEQVQANADKIKGALSKDQFKTAVSEAKKVYEKAYPGTLAKLDPKKYTDDSFFQYYVENVLMDDITIDLLDKLSKQ